MSSEIKIRSIFRLGVLTDQQAIRTSNTIRAALMIVETVHEIGIMMNPEEKKEKKREMISKFIQNHYTNIPVHKSCLENKIQECYI